MNDIREALVESAQSLESIADQAGKCEYMDDMIGVRAYARSRAHVARAALAAPVVAQPLTDQKILDLLGPIADEAMMENHRAYVVLAGRNIELAVKGNKT